MKKTKVVCTMGPNTNDRELMRKLIQNGMDVARFNFSHGDHEEHKGRMDLLKQLREEEHANTAILLDTKGPEIRTGVLKDGKKVMLEAGQTFVLTTEQIEGDEKRVSISYEGLTEDVDAGKTILIRQVKETAPVYYALGNHEEAYIADGHPELEDELAEAGAVVLDKNYTDIEVNGVQIRLGGMYDYAFGLNGNNDALAAPDDTLSFLREFQNTDRLKIMLAHRPDSFIFGDASQVWDVDLVISGHNHGGQVILPFLGGLYGGDQGWFPEYVHGMYEKGNFQMFVTSGLGSNRQKLPRFNNPPEVAVLTIR